MNEFSATLRCTAFAVLLGTYPVAADTPSGSLPPDLDIPQLFIDDMSVPNAVRPAGIDSGWAQKPRVGLGNVMPEGWDHAIMCGQIYAGRPGNPATNVRVQIRDCALWVLSRRNRAWKLLLHSVTPDGHAYREDFGKDANISADVRWEPDGSASVKLVSGYNYHQGRKVEGGLEQQQRLGDRPFQATDEALAALHRLHLWHGSRQHVLSKGSESSATAILRTHAKRRHIAEHSAANQQVMGGTISARNHDRWAS